VAGWGWAQTVERVVRGFSVASAANELFERGKWGTVRVGAALWEK
jgi:hypothetical protein